MNIFRFCEIIDPSLKQTQFPGPSPDITVFIPAKLNIDSLFGTLKSVNSFCIVRLLSPHGKEEVSLHSVEGVPQRPVGGKRQVIFLETLNVPNILSSNHRMRKLRPRLLDFNLNFRQDLFTLLIFSEHVPDTPIVTLLSVFKSTFVPFI